MIDEFVQWIQSIGIDTSKIVVRWNKTNGFGLYPRRIPVEEKEILLSIRSKDFLRPEIDVQQSNRNGFEQLIEYLLTNPLNPYVKYLQSIDPIPSWRNVSIEEFPLEFHSSMFSHLNIYKSTRDKFLQFDENKFRWAFYSVFTRSIHLPIRTDTNDPNENLCLIPFFDFVNHSNESNSKAIWNEKDHWYQIQLLKRIDSIDEEITFHYNSHSNLDLFIDYGFVLESNPFNCLNIENYLRKILSKDDIDRLESSNYFTSLKIYSTSTEISWTILKSIDLILRKDRWSPLDDIPIDQHESIRQILSKIFQQIRFDLDEHFSHWNTEDFEREKKIFLDDYHRIIEHNFFLLKNPF